MSKNNPKLKTHINPKTKKRLFREMMSILIEKTVNDDLHFEAVIHCIRECAGGLMFQFSDGVINVMDLEKDYPVWRCDGKRSKLMNNWAQKTITETHYANLLRIIPRAWGFAPQAILFVYQRKTNYIL